MGNFPLVDNDRGGLVPPLKVPDKWSAWAVPGVYKCRVGPWVGPCCWGPGLLQSGLAQGLLQPAESVGQPELASAGTCTSLPA